MIEVILEARRAALQRYAGLSALALESRVGAAIRQAILKARQS